MPQAKITVNAVIGSNDDLPINVLVQLDNLNIGGEVSYLWTVLDQPPGAIDSLSSTTIKNPTITPKKEGTYLISLTVNQGLATQQYDSIILGVRQLKSRERIPAAGETTQDDLSDGWAKAANALLRHWDALFSDPGVVVGVNGSGGVLTRGTVLRATGGAVIKTGLPGQETVPSFVPALATTLGNVDELLVCLEGGVDGSTNPGAGALVRARYLGRMAGLALGGGVVGDKVYDSDTAQVALVPGTVRRQLGSIMAQYGATQDVWFDGVGGADITPVDLGYLVYGTTGVLPNAFRVDGASATGPTGGVGFTFTVGDNLTPALSARRKSAAGADIQRWLDETSTILARVAVDGQIIGLHGLSITGDGTHTTAIVGTGGAGNNHGIQGNGAGTGTGVRGIGAAGATSLGGYFAGGTVAAAGTGGAGSEFHGGDAGVDSTLDGVGGAGIVAYGGIGYAIPGPAGSQGGAGVVARGGANINTAGGSTFALGAGPGVDAIGGSTDGGAGSAGVGGMFRGGTTPNPAMGAAGVSSVGSGTSQGVDGVGGLGGGHGVTGEGTGVGMGVVGTGGATNADGVHGIGGGGTGAGVSGVGGTNGPGVQGTATGTGPGVKGIANATAPGVLGVGAAASPGLDGEPVGVAAGNRAAGHLGPQKAALGSVAQGDLAMVQPNVVSPGDAKWNAAASASQVDRYVPQVAAGSGDTVTSAAPTTTLHTIAANSLRTGSEIEVFVAGRITNNGAGGGPTWEMVLELNDGTTTEGIPCFAAAPNSENIVFRFRGIVAADPGAAVNVGYGVWTYRDANHKTEGAALSSALNTTVGIAVRLTMVVAGSVGTVFTIYGWSVRVT